MGNRGRDYASRGGRPILIFLLSTLTAFTIIGPGHISAADPGVLEAVAERRAKAGWGLSGDWQAYEVLIAPPDCALLGRSGWLVVNDDLHTAIVVDCAQAEHRQAMVDNGLLADANRAELAHLEGWLVLR